MNLGGFLEVGKGVFKGGGVGCRGRIGDLAFSGAMATVNGAVVCYVEECAVGIAMGEAWHRHV